MYCKTITKEIFDSYIANDSDSVLEGVVTNTFEGTAFRRFVRVPLAKGEHYVEALYEQDFGSFPLAMGANHFSIKNGLEWRSSLTAKKPTASLLHSHCSLTITGRRIPTGSRLK